MSEYEADIVIIGAGPTGLLMANLLSYQKDLNILIVDKKKKIEQLSKCTTIQPRIVQLLKKIGAKIDTDRFIYGLKSRIINHEGDNLGFYSDFNTFNHKPALSIPQYQIELQLMSLLSNKSNVTILFNTEF